MVVLATVLASVAQLLYKLGANALPSVTGPLFVGFALYCFAGLLIVLALKKLDMSVVFPMLATTFVWVALLSLFYLGESLSLLHWSGIALIVAGVALLGVSK